MPVKQSDHHLPYGLRDLDPVVQAQEGIPRKVRCFVRGCSEILETPTRYEAGQVCPRHGIRCHYSSAGPTYSYADVRGNAIVAQDLLANRIVGHPFKYESHRLGSERSEDMLSFNVFRSLQEAGGLHRLAAGITGDLVQRPLCVQA